MAAGDLSRVVANEAQRLSVATAADAVERSEQVLTNIAEHFDLDVAFLRHNDHQIRATVLIAQWPIRSEVPDPDPIGTVFFDSADPVFAMAEHLKEPSIARSSTDPDYQRRIEEGTSVPAITLAAVPLLTSEGVTSGTLGFIKFGDREWTTEEINGLQTIATLFAHLKDRLEAGSALRWRATHDDQTGLANRRTLLQHLDQRLLPGQPGPVALLYINLDRLAAINNLHGPAVRDQVLDDSVERLRTHLGATAFLSHLGSNDLVAVLNDPTSLTEAHSLARRVRTKLHAHVDGAAGLIKSTVSIGVADGRPGEASTSDLLGHAEHSLNQARASGGNTIAVFTEDLAATHALRTDIEVHLFDAINSNDIFLQHQPEIDLQTGAVVAIESQLRWNHPKRGLLYPDTFIPVAESINLAAALDRRALWLACAQLHTWRLEGLSHGIALRVKVNPVVTVTEGFVDDVAKTLEHFAIPPTALSLEIAESVVVEEAAASRETLNALKRLQIGLVLDRFGTSYSDLAGLKTLPVDTVKIAPPFVRNIDQDAGDLAIIRSVIALADSFGLDVIADGLESPAAADILVREGCRRAQGPLLCPPLDAGAMRSLLAKPVVPTPLVAQRQNRLA